MQEKHRPPQLAPTPNSLAAARIVSPIVPLLMSEEMQKTLRDSQSIRQQQTQLIADANTGSRPGVAGGPKLLPDSESGQELAPQSGHNSNASSVENSAQTSSQNSPLQKSSGTPPTLGASSGRSVHEQPETTVLGAHQPSGSLSSDTDQDPEYDRISSSTIRKKLKRDRAPGPLQLPGYAPGLTPTITSAPIRTIYSGHTWPSYTGKVGPGGPSGPGHVVPAYFLPRRIPMRAWVPLVPYSAVQMGSHTPGRRVAVPVQTFPERRPSKGRRDRRKPVQDVFVGAVTKEAPMNSQPPSAQRERFDNQDDDRSEATEEEMREMERKRQAHSMVQGTISFNNESAFNFKLFRLADDDAKEKFLKMCEATWNQYTGQS